MPSVSAGVSQAAQDLCPIVGTNVLGVPRARRRRSRAAARRGWSRTLLVILLVALVVVLAVGSLVEVHAQSSQFRTSTNIGYGELASLVVDASNRTGDQLATLMEKAPQLPNSAFPYSARAEIEQGLDQAVQSTSDQARQAEDLVPPYPSGTVSAQFTDVMAERASATSHLRAGIDQLLGMSPLPVAGSTKPTSIPASAPLISVDQAATQMGGAGLLLQQADAAYRGLASYVHRQKLSVRLPGSVWVPLPLTDAPLSSTRLSAAASALATSPALAPIHQLVITAIGLSPPSVATGGPGVIGVGCGANAASVLPGPSPTVLPPTGSVTVDLTLTNCGTVTESGAVVSQALALADPAGTPLPPKADRGGRTQSRVTLAAGASTALTLPALSMAGGHLYLLSVTVAPPVAQANPAGTSQQILLQITG